MPGSPSSRSSSSAPLQHGRPEIRHSASTSPSTTARPRSACSTTSPTRAPPSPRAPPPPRSACPPPPPPRAPPPRGALPSRVPQHPPLPRRGRDGARSERRPRDDLGEKARRLPHAAELSLPDHRAVAAHFEHRLGRVLEEAGVGAHGTGGPPGGGGRGGGGGGGTPSGGGGGRAARVGLEWAR